MKQRLKAGVCTVFGALSLGLCSGAQAEGLDITHSVKAITTAFSQEAKEGQRNNNFEASFLYSAKTKMYLNDQFSMVASGYAHVGTPSHLSGVLVGPHEGKARSPFVDLIELGLQWDGDNSTIKVGKWKQNYEFAERMTLLNRFNLGDYTFPMNNVSTGNWLLQWQRFFDSGNLNVTVMPYHPSTGQPPENTRWSGVNGSGVIEADKVAGFGLGGGGGGNVTSEGSTIFTDKPDVSLIWEGTTDRFDYLLGASRAQSLYSVSKYDIDARVSQTEYPYASNLFGGISWPLDSKRFYMEALYQDTDDGRDDDFVRVTTGMSFNMFNQAEKLGLADFNFFVEFLADRTVNRQSNDNYRIPSFNSRAFQNALFVGATAKINDDWSFSQDIARGFSKRDSMLSSKLEYSFDDSTRLSMRYTRFDGIDGMSLFGNWKQNDNLTLMFTKDF